MKNKFFNIRAFTLMEIMVVCMIAAVLAVVMYPSYAVHVKKVKSSEGVTVLSSIYLAQKEYRQDTGGYANSLSKLNVTIASMANFKDLTAYSSGSASCSGGSAQTALASVVDNAGEYTLYVLENGKVVCNPCNGICQNLGFQTW